jgi:methylmalonyl-CoA mutase cobalamin-binding subunit/DNA-binding transcriptional MerR regulator
VEPVRSAGGQRLYRDSDVARLRLLRRVTELGHSIGRVARLSTAALSELLEEEAAEHAESAGGVPSTEGERSGEAAAAALALAQAIEAARALDLPALHSVLMRSVVSLRSDVFVELVAVPLLVRVGDWWAEGTMRPSEEHVVSAALSRVLAWLMEQGRPGPGAPAVLLTTLEGERHELGAMLAGVLATAEGWRPVYLGPDLPPDEIVAAARTADAHVVAISMIYMNGEAASEQIYRVRAGLPRNVLMVIGGAASAALDDRGSASAMRLADLTGFRLALRALGAPRPRSTAPEETPP